MLKFPAFFALFLLLGLGFQACQKENFSSSGMADDHFFLVSRGQSMPITLAGNLDANKIIVIIHGGPGGSAIVYRDSYVRQNIETRYALAYWDQRLAGSSQGNGGPKDISEFRRDMRALVQLLKAKYGANKKIYLFGHSWGGFLSPYFLLESQNQALVDGWIQIGGAHNYRMNDSLTREMLLFYGRQELQANRNTEDWQEIVDWCQENGFSGRANAGRLNGFAHRAEGLMPDVISPSIDFADVFGGNRVPMTAQFFSQLGSGIQAIDEPTYTEPISENLSRITVPTLLLWGKYDFVCPPELALDIEANISSSSVEKQIFNGSGHSPMMNEPTAFWNTVLDWLARH